MVITNCSSSNKDLLKASAAVLEQILSTENRKYVVEHGLEIVINMTLSLKDNHEFAKITTGILEGLFKVSMEASSKIVALGITHTTSHDRKLQSSKHVPRLSKWHSSV
jgi:maleate cis-trans isomerase